MDDIKRLPEDLGAAVSNLDEYQLNKPYREGGWTLNQVVHHLTDSHMNSFITFKLGLTETNPTALSYNEKRFADLSDVVQVSASVSVNIVRSLCQRWYTLLENMSDDDFKRTIIHSGIRRTDEFMDFFRNVCMHGKHHVAHITSLKKN